ncbi:MAG: porin family protein [Acidobacteria bacterium]|nr:porin family protein [Acidobacteriota bacterium]
MMLTIMLGGGDAGAQERAGDASKVEVGAQFSSLSTNEPGEFGGTENHVGFGGRVTYNFNNYFAVEAEGNFFPNKTFETISTGGRVVQGQFGVKVGRRFDKFGVFAKARPGFVSFGETTKLIASQTIIGGVPFPFIDFSTERKTHFSTDIGGVLEFYPSRRIVTRFDVGDTIIRYGRRNDIAPFLILPPPGTFAAPIIQAPAETKHNFQFSAGVGYRFGGGDDRTQSRAATTTHDAGEHAPRYEVGVQFSTLVFNPPRPVFGFPVIFSDDISVNPEAGFGGRFTFNLNDNVGLEAQGDFYPRKSFAGNTSGGYPSQMQFGAKIGRRFDKFGVFGKARPGFVSFSRVRQLVGTQVITFSPQPGVSQQFIIGIFADKRKTYFSADVGGVVEFYPSRRIMTRFDMGDTIIHYSRRHEQGFSLSQNIIEIAPETKHNLQISAGIGFRF